MRKVIGVMLVVLLIAMLVSSCSSNQQTDNNSNNDKVVVEETGTSESAGINDIVEDTFDDEYVEIGSMI